MLKLGRALFVILLFVSPLAAQTVRGRVTLQGDGSPLPGVTVSVESMGLSTITDADGRFTLAVPGKSGELKVTATLQGFQTRTVNAPVGDADTQIILRPSFGEQITVGSRAIGAEQEKAVPVDVIKQEAIATSPSTETSQIIQKIAPSFNFPRPTISDGTDSVRPATLR